MADESSTISKLINKAKTAFSNKNPSASTWDDPGAGEALAKAILGSTSDVDYASGAESESNVTNGSFYGKVEQSGNHRNVSGHTNQEGKCLSAYDGDEIEGAADPKTRKANLNAHAVMTTEDLASTTVAYSRGSLLSAGLTRSEWENSAIGVNYTNDGGKTYYDYFTDEAAQNQQSSNG